MKKLRFKLTGLTSLIMHNPQTVDPLNKYTKALKEITDKQSKQRTDAENAMLSRIEWEAGLYLNEGKTVVPGRCLDACFWCGAKKSKKGMVWLSGAVLEEDFYILKYDGPMISANGSGTIPNPELDKYYEKNVTRSIENVRGAKVIRSRPIFNNWCLETSILYDETILNKKDVVNAVKKAGEVCGLLEGRPRLGRFEYEIV